MRTLPIVLSIILAGCGGDPIDEVVEPTVEEQWEQASPGAKLCLSSEAQTAFESDAQASEELLSTVSLSDEDARVTIVLMMVLGEVAEGRRIPAVVEENWDLMQAWMVDHGTANPLLFRPCGGETVDDTARASSWTCESDCKEALESATKSAAIELAKEGVGALSAVKKLAGVAKAADATFKTVGTYNSAGDMAKALTKDIDDPLVVIKDGAKAVTGAIGLVGLAGVTGPVITAAAVIGAVILAAELGYKAYGGWKQYNECDLGKIDLQCGCGDDARPPEVGGVRFVEARAVWNTGDQDSGKWGLNLDEPLTLNVTCGDAESFTVYAEVRGELFVEETDALYVEEWLDLQMQPASGNYDVAAKIISSELDGEYQRVEVEWAFERSMSCTPGTKTYQFQNVVASDCSDRDVDVLGDTRVVLTVQ
ncbi:MAG: hypothetical protein ACI9MC_000721 [Kiritimatiellia bacterium]|jgi:hypothetical protein